MTTIRSIRSRWSRLAPALAPGLFLAACDILDVKNPNNLTEESISSPSAASAVVNGAVAQNARGISTQWLGYLIQRPEAHCVHHRKGVHAYNYGDLPLWDILLGTFRNPREFNGECGFEGPGDRRLRAMLAFADANAPLYGPGNLGQAPTTPAAS